MKKAIIFGDSYSTFQNYIPKGYETYYSDSVFTGTDVTKVSQTWWHQAVLEAGLELVLNDSWSGSTIGYTGYDNADNSKSSSFIYRLKKLIEDGFFTKNKIDTVFVFGGTNDCCSGAPLGERKQENIEETDLYFVLPAVFYFFKLLKETLPKAQIYCLINTDIKEEIVSCMKEACEKYDIVPVSFESIDKQCGHPTIEGMRTIKTTVLKALNSSV